MISKPFKLVKEEFLVDDSIYEKLDTTPMAIPLGFSEPETLAEQIKRLTKQSLAEFTGSDDVGTFDDEDDFDIEDDYMEDFETPFEVSFEGDPHGFPPMTDTGKAPVSEEGAGSKAPDLSPAPQEHGDQPSALT